MLAVGPGGRRRDQGTGRQPKIQRTPRRVCDKPLFVCRVQVSSACSLSVTVPTACRMAFVPVTTVSLTFPSLLHFFQNSLIKRIKGENVYVKHSNLMLEVGIGIDQCMPVCGVVLPWHPCGLEP